MYACARVCARVCVSVRVYCAFLLACMHIYSFVCEATALNAAAFAFACISHSALKTQTARRGARRGSGAAGYGSGNVVGTGKYASFAWKNVFRARSRHILYGRVAWWHRTAAFPTCRPSCLAASLPRCLVAWLPMRHSFCMQCNNSFAYKWFSFAHLNAIHLPSTCPPPCCLLDATCWQIQNPIDAPHLCLFITAKSTLKKCVCANACARVCACIQLVLACVCMRVCVCA